MLQVEYNVADIDTAAGGLGLKTMVAIKGTHPVTCTEEGGDHGYTLDLCEGGQAIEKY